MRCSRFNCGISGRSLEIIGNGGSREMAASLKREQNPAYSHPFFEQNGPEF